MQIIEWERDKCHIQERNASQQFVLLRSLHSLAAGQTAAALFTRRADRTVASAYLQGDSIRINHFDVIYIYLYRFIKSNIEIDCESEHALSSLQKQGIGSL